MRPPLTRLGARRSRTWRPRARRATSATRHQRTTRPTIPPDHEELTDVPQREEDPARVRRSRRLHRGDRLVVRAGWTVIGIALALATGRDPEPAAVALTEAPSAAGTCGEGRGVTAPELSPLGNPDILIGSLAANVATRISFVADMTTWGAVLGGNRGDDDGHAHRLALLATALLAPVAAALLQTALSRHHEVVTRLRGTR